MEVETIKLQFFQQYVVVNHIKGFLKIQKEYTAN